MGKHEATGGWFTNKAYDVLKFTALVVLPALATFYLGLGQIWPVPKPDEVAQTIILVDTFLGVVLQLSKVSYSEDEVVDGTLRVQQVGDTVRPRGVDLPGISTGDLQDGQKLVVQVRAEEAPPPLS